jgi:hypothetical protein
VIIELRVEIDDTAADAFNAALFEPDHDDPVQGNGRSLVIDVIRDSGIDEIIRSSDWKKVTKSVTATIDGKPFRYPRNSW